MGAFIRVAIIAQVFLFSLGLAGAPAAATAVAGTAAAVMGAAAVPATAGSAPQRILIYGDSLSAGFALAVDEGFAPQLEQALKMRGFHVKIFNASLSGETTAGGLRRLAWTLKRLPPMDIAVLELGANDGLRGQPPKETQANLGKIIQRLKEQKIKVLLTGMKAVRNFGTDYGRRFDGLYPALAKRHKVALYPFFLEGVVGAAELNLKDGIHPNPKGIKVIVSKILPFVIEVLQRAKKGEKE